MTSQLVFILAVACAGPVGIPGRFGVPRLLPELISPLGRPLFAAPPAADREKLEAELAQARACLAEKPDDPDRIIWVGRRLGYLWRMREAIEVFSDGIRNHPQYAPLYRHRGHRYISIRLFDHAIHDLETAAKLIEGRPDEMEPDGAPNSKNIPLTTTGFNVWYHLGVARYLKGDYDGSLSAFRICMNFLGGHDDNLVAVTDWMYMTLIRLGQKDEALKILETITPEMVMIENAAYHRRCLLYKGVIKPDEFLSKDLEGELNLATSGYGLGNWYLQNGVALRGVEILERVVDGPYWPAFGYIAAETDLVRLYPKRSTQSPAP